METFDIVVAGGGYVGLSTALAIKSAAPHLSILLVDPAPPLSERKGTDLRASAIALSAKRMLSELDVWPALEKDAQPITSMIVTDSKTQDAVRPVFLTFGGEVEEGEPFAHMIPNGAMVSALEEKARAAGVDIRFSERAIDFHEEAVSMTVALASGNSVSTRLLIAADGVRSTLRDLAGIKTVHWDYGQSGIVTTVSHEKDHGGEAIEHFLPAGPFAILPLTHNRSSLVWTERRSEADKLIHGDDFVFEVELERRFGHHLGAISVIGDKRAYPLGLTLAKEFVGQRFALVGDSAHGIHPIAGQGLNLGFRDVAALAEVIVEADRLGMDIGMVDVLERYQRWRRFDTWLMGFTTDVLNRLFSNRSDSLRLLRTIGLGAVDRVPRLKDFFIAQAAGTVAPDQPRLLTGAPI
ncbi:MAG: ubiquinone biosynthesis hydroxylase [Pseudomonadota bacterium]